jgi:hypothetical protein
MKGRLQEKKEGNQKMKLQKRQGAEWSAHGK